MSNPSVRCWGFRSHPLRVLVPGRPPFVAVEYVVCRCHMALSWKCRDCVRMADAWSCSARPRAADRRGAARVAVSVLSTGRGASDRTTAKARVISHRSGRPLTWGILRPTIALPERICFRANHEQLRTDSAPRAGSCSSRRRRGNLLFEFALPLLALHPLYWWLRRQARMSAELLADDWAARQAGRELYVTQLVALARGTNLRRLSLVFGTGVLTNPSQFYRRMKMLLTREQPLPTRLSIFWRLSSAGAVLAAAGLAAAFVGNPSASADEPTKPAAVEPASPAAAGLPSADAKDVPRPEVAPLAVDPAAAPAEESTPDATPNAASERGRPLKSRRSRSAKPARRPKAAAGTPGLPGVSDLPAVGRLFVSKSTDDPRVTTQQLQAERDELRKQVQVLKARLEQLEANFETDRLADWQRREARTGHPTDAPREERQARRRNLDG